MPSVLKRAAEGRSTTRQVVSAPAPLMAVAAPGPRSVASHPGDTDCVESKPANAFRWSPMARTNAPGARNGTCPFGGQLPVTAPLDQTAFAIFRCPDGDGWK